MTVLPRVSYPTYLTLPQLPWFNFLRILGRQVVALPGLAGLNTLAQRAISVTHPPVSVTGRPDPHSPPAVRETLAVLSANLWHDWPRHRLLEERLEAFARLVEETGADLLLLQEVAHTHRLNAYEWLARRLGMAYFYVRANGHFEAIGFEEGLAVFSRFPLRHPKVVQLGKVQHPFTRRLALSVRVETPYGLLHAFCAHLGLLPKENARQVADLQGWVRQVSAGETALIGGDFNASENSSQIAAAQRTWLDPFRILHPERDGATHTLHGPGGMRLHRARLDYIFLQPGVTGWQVDSAEHIP